MKLNDVCELITCGVAKRPEYVEDGIPFLSSKNVKEDRFILDHYNYVSKEDYLKLTKHNKPEKGDVLYTRVGSFGQAAVVDFEFDFAVFVSLTLIKPKKEIVDSRYLMHYLNNPFIRNLANNSTSGIGVQNLNVKVVREFPIDLPPIKTQKQIASILDHAAALRDKTAKLLEEYDLLAQSIFLEMFGDTYSNPKNFPIMLIEELAAKRKHSIKAGPFGSSLKKEFYVESGYKIYGQEQVINDDLDFGDYYIDEDRFQKLKSCAVSEGDILVSLVGTYGKITVVPKLFEPGIINPRLMKISPNQDIIRPDFLKTILKSNGVAFQLKNKSRGGTMDIINVGIIRKVRTLVPPIEHQNQFAKKIALIEQQKALAKQELQEAEDLFNCLLQKAFKGELI